jgi:hypothetical protein
VFKRKLILVFVKPHEFFKFGFAVFLPNLIDIELIFKRKEILAIFRAVHLNNPENRVIVAEAHWQIIL